jgi:hypothetical protein
MPDTPISGHVYRHDGARGPVSRAKYRLGDGRQVPPEGRAGVDGVREATGRLCTSMGGICPVSVTARDRLILVGGLPLGLRENHDRGRLHVEPTPAASIWLTGTAGSLSAPGARRITALETSGREPRGERCPQSGSLVFLELSRQDTVM